MYRSLDCVQKFIPSHTTQPTDTQQTALPLPPATRPPRTPPPPSSPYPPSPASMTGRQASLARWPCRASTAPGCCTGGSGKETRYMCIPVESYMNKSMYAFIQRGRARGTCMCIPCRTGGSGESRGGGGSCVMYMCIHICVMYGDTLRERRASSVCTSSYQPPSPHNKTTAPKDARRRPLAHYPPPQNHIHNTHSY